MPITTDLLSAFERTRYIVHADTPVVLRIGRYSPDLKKLHDTHNATCSAFITAFNPGSVARTPELNAASQHELRRELSGYTCYEGLGQPEDGDWQGEPSILVLNIPEAEAVDLGKKYGQLAIVYCGEDAVPRLKYLKGLPD